MQPSGSNDSSVVQQATHTAKNPQLSQPPNLPSPLGALSQKKKKVTDTANHSVTS